MVWLIPTFLTVHSAEEGIALRRMWTRMPALLPEPFASLEARLPYSAMVQALLGLSALAFVLAAVAVARPQSRAPIWIILALEAAVAINVAAHVISAVAIFRGYSPGLGTALLVNAPFAWYTLRRARNEEWVSRRAWRALGVGGAVLHGPVLLAALWLMTTQR